MSRNVIFAKLFNGFSNQIELIKLHQICVTFCWYISLSKRTSFKILGQVLFMGNKWCLLGSAPICCFCCNFFYFISFQIQTWRNLIWEKKLELDLTALFSWVLVLLGLVLIRANSFSIQLRCLIWKVGLECLETVSCQWKHFTPCQVSFKCQQLNIFKMDIRPISEWNILYFHFSSDKNLVSERNTIRKLMCFRRPRLNLVNNKLSFMGGFAKTRMTWLVCVQHRGENYEPCPLALNQHLSLDFCDSESKNSGWVSWSDFTQSVANDWPAYSPNRMSDALTLPTLGGDPASKLLTAGLNPDIFPLLFPIACIWSSY